MSLYGALFSGVSGLQAQSSAMGAIADNVTNVNTIGYKGTKVNFQTLITKQVSLTQYSAGGVQAKPRQGVDIQGLLQSTSSATDVGISGQGFFVVNEAAQPTTGNMYGYTRAGSFKVDKEGYLQNVGGFYMQGWPLQTWDSNALAAQVEIGNNTYMKSYTNSSGETVYMNDNIVDSTNLQPLNLNTIGGTASNTTTLSFGANLPADDDVGATQQANMLIYDTLGNAHNLDFTYVNRATNSWDLEIMPPEGSNALALKDQNAGIYTSAGRLDFLSTPDDGDTMTVRAYNEADGSLQTYTITFESSTAATDDSFVRGLSGDDLAAQVTTNGRTLSQVIDQVATTIDKIMQDASGVSTSSNSAPTHTTTTDGAAAATEVNDVTWQDFSGPGTQTFDDIVVTATAPATAAEVAAVVAGGTVAGLSLVDGGNWTIGAAAGDVNTLTYAAGNGVVAAITPTSTTTNGTTPTSSSKWAERISGESSIVMRQFTSNGAITIDASNLMTGTANSLQQSSSYSISALDATHGWVTGGSSSTTDTERRYVAFNGDGTPSEYFGSDETEAADPRGSINIDWANGSSDMDGSTEPEISLFQGNYNVADGITQFAGAYQINYISQNGATFGNYAGVSIGSDGVVTALFDNGVTIPVFMIPVATFVNPNSMESISGNMWIETDFSGQPTIREPGEGGAGSTNAAALEASTVDLGAEFTDMITTQRAYSAAAKIISTSDEMLEELIRIKR